jgi:transcriptional regulator NrdR family protein
MRDGIKCPYCGSTLDGPERTARKQNMVARVRPCPSCSAKIKTVEMPQSIIAASLEIENFRRGATSSKSDLH